MQFPKFAVRRHGQQWYVRFSAGGRRYQKPCGRTEGTSEAEAREAAKEVIRAIVGQIDRASRERETQNPLVKHAKKLESKSESHRMNAARFRARLIDYFGPFQDFLLLTAHDVELWRDWLLTKAKRHDRRPGNLGDKTVKEHIDWLASVYNNAGIPNPCAGVDRPKPSEADRAAALKYFTPDEMNILFEVAAKHHQRFYNGFIFLAFTGCRVAEVQGITEHDIDRQNQIVSVVGKGGRPRSLKLTGPLSPAWDAVIDEANNHPKDHGFVFSQSPSWASKGMLRLCRRALGRHGHPHMLRHTFATLALQHWRPTWEISRVAKWLGHKNYDVTYRIYGHLLAEEPPSGYDARYKPGTRIISVR